MSRKYAYFGLSSFIDGFPTAPEGGFCLGSFLIYKKSGSVLLGRFSDSSKWTDLVGMRKERIAHWAKSDKWMLPASHLRFGEAPENGAKRIARDQLKLKDFTVKLLKVQSFVDEEEKDHWDICFVYNLKTDEQIKKAPWFSELKLVDTSRLTVNNFARGQGDVLLDLGLIKK